MSRLSSVTDQSYWPRAAIFDCDGLLVDSSRCWRRAYESIASALGRALAESQLAALLGASVAGAAAYLGREFGEPVDEEQLHALLIESFLADPPLALPGASMLVTELAERMPVGIASNAPRKVLELALAELRLTIGPRAVVSAESTFADKPAPDLYLEACRRLETSPSDAVGFEDSPLGAQAARSAGLFVVAIPSAPTAEIDADLRFGRLDDPRLLMFLGLEHPTGAFP